MTNKEALQAVIVEEASENLLTKALLDYSISGDASYAASNASLVNSAAIAALQTILSLPDITEGGFSKKYDRSAIQKRIDLLQGVQAAATAAPVIRNASNRW